MSTHLIVIAAAFTTGCLASMSAGPGSGPPPPPPGPGEPVTEGGMVTPIEANAGGPASTGWTLQERQYWQKLQEEMTEYARKANDHCRTNITASYAQETFRGQLTAGGNYGLPQYTRSVCTAALSALVDVCTNGNAAKDAVRAGVRHVVCAYGPTTYALQGGVFNVTIDASDENLYVYQRGMVDVLEKSL